MGHRSLRSRMMILFCAVVGVLLAVSFASFYLMFSNVLRAQLDQDPWADRVLTIERIEPWTLWLRSTHSRRRNNLTDR